ncbi:hypothetical protein BJ878DRAFT_485970 [Calycina marina]|uniref:Uncharacterized protein n=1 Tax=Calycina marina TaxID=1763456 RepID=A0A9P7ZCI0_9HELO|nr:hypothetical protein BJ878DRAFT_485970 [Calycina marina]
MALQIATKVYLEDLVERQFFHVPILIEKELFPIMLFGPTFTWIVTCVLSHFSNAMAQRYNPRVTRFLTDFSPREDSACVTKHLDFYEGIFKDRFGVLEPLRTQDHGKILRIDSLGMAIKLFVCLIMADRMSVIREKCKEARERSGFVLMVRLSSLCLSCLDLCYRRLLSQPLRRTAQSAMLPSTTRPQSASAVARDTLGAQFMKQWLCGRMEVVLPETFMRKLFTPEQYKHPIGVLCWL